MKKKFQNSYLQAALKNVNNFERLLQTKGESFWQKRGKNMMKKLFQEKSQHVPAYKNFLKKYLSQNQNSTTILTDKQNYLRQFPLNELCWEGNLGGMKGVISSTSGSTGEPFYFPRTEEQDLMYSLTAQLYLKNNFQCDKKSTLYICAFPMGPWIGGVFTYEAVRTIVKRTGWEISIITTSINKSEVINALKKFGDKYQQIIIGSYGPFLKDFLDDAILEGVDLKKMNIKFIFSAEGFSEYFRQYVYELVADTKDENFNYFTRSLNHYGTVDLGTMSYETPICILIRKLGIENILFYEELFGIRHKLPTLTQYIPEHFYFESYKKENEKFENILCSSYSGLPLYKYDLKDHGGVRTYEFVNSLAKKYFKKSLKDLAKEHGIEKTLWQIPFVFVYERADFSVSLYAFQVYPETIRKALQRDRKIYSKITGKFSMETMENSKQEPYLEVNIELKRNVNLLGESFLNGLKQEIEKILLDRLLVENSEYKQVYEMRGGDFLPKVVFFNYESPEYFRPGIKQKWVIKSKK